MVKKFFEFIESGIELHYYCFDWDDNLLHMPSKIHMDNLIDGKWVPTDVSTSEFAKVRNDKENWRLVNNLPDHAFCEFKDSGPRGADAFLIDTKASLSEKSFGPVWSNFIECLTEGAIFAIITARGHEPSSIRKSVEYIIDHVLTDQEKFLLYSNCLKHVYIFKSDAEFDRIPKGKLSQTPLIKKYLDVCDFYGVTSDSFAKEFGKSSAVSPEQAKEQALDKFINKCNRLGKRIGAKSVSVGFSDDDQKNVEHVRKFFKEKSALSNELPHKLKLNLYKTTDRKLKGGERTKFHESTSPSQAPGMASSVMPFTQFNSMTSRLFPSETADQQDPTLNMSKLSSKYLAKLSKDIERPKKRKRLKK